MSEKWLNWFICKIMTPYVVAILEYKKPPMNSQKSAEKSNIKWMFFLRSHTSQARKQGFPIFGSRFTQIDSEIIQYGP